MLRWSSIVGGLVLGAAAAASVVPQKPPKPDKGGKKPPVEAPAPPPRLAPFAGRFSEAKARAAERNVPLLVHVVLEAEEASDRYRDALLGDAELLRASQELLVIVANNGQHATKTIEERGADGQPVQRTFCALYGTPDCKTHNRHWEEAFREFKREDGVLSCPQLILLAPDGSFALRVDNGEAPPASAVLGAVQECAGKFGPGLSETALARVRVLIGEGEAHLGAKRWLEAVRAWRELSALAPQGPFAKTAGAALPSAERGLADEIEGHAARLVPGTAGEAYGALTALAQRAAGLPIEKEIAARLKKAEGERALQPEIAAWKREQEALALWTEAQKLEQQGEAKKAQGVARKLLAPRFAATQAAQRARSKWPELAAEEDAKRAKE